MGVWGGGGSEDEPWAPRARGWERRTGGVPKSHPESWPGAWWGGGEERPGGSGAAGGRGETWSPRPRSHHHTGPFPRGWHARWLGWGAGWGGVGSES